MYLKRVELNGFKSFADRTELEFAPGITAVVGPNGSGKSNITDAIRWVLGEQSAKSLRGAKMEDVIFAGSETRKHVNFCEVSLVLDNEDKALNIEYSEVMLTRRLYRSGESEYYLNNQTCRLKDITELLMDTGIGKEAYSIIGQGKIDEILSSKAEDRRGVFEEAAGIVKYKTRKREAKKRLEETEQNLIRISDLISELEGQIQPLEEQAKTARQYKEYVKKLKDLNIQIYVHDIEKAYRDWQETERLKKEMENDQIDLNSKVNKIDSVIEEKRWNVAQLDKELEDLHKTLVTVSEKVEQTEGKREVLKEREKNQQLNKSQTLETIEKYMQKKSEINNQLETEKNKLDKIEAKITDFTEQLSKEEESLNQLISNHEADIESLKSEYFECLNQMATLRNELRHTDNTKESLNYRLDKLKIETEQLEGKKETVLSSKSDAELELSEIKQQNELLAEEYNNNILSEKEFLTKLKYIQNKLNEEQQKLNSLLSRSELLSEMQADFTGFQNGVKEILKLRDSDSLKGIKGAIAELLTVSKKYETAIETALGSSLQYIAVEKESIGREAIAYLKERKLGRATFLPLDVIKGRRLNNNDLVKISKVNGFIGTAIELIEFEQQYLSIVEYLLGQVIVTSNLKAANEIARILGYSKRVVTLEGDLVNPGGSMTGGSIQKKNVGLLGRQRELEELSQQIESIKKSVHNEKSNFDAVTSSLNKLNERLEELRLKNEQHKGKEQELNSQIQQLSYESKSINDRLTILNQDISQIQSDLNQAVLKEEEIINELNEKEQSEKELQNRITDAESLRKQDETDKQIMNQKVTGLKIELARVEQERDGSKLIIEKLMMDFNEINNTVELNQQNLIQLENDLTIQQNDQSNLSQDIQQIRIEKDLLQKEIEEKRLSRSRYLQEIESEQIGSKELRKNLQLVESGIHQYEVKLSRLDVELNNLLHQLSEEYEMSYEWAKENVEKIEDVKGAKEEVKQLKSKVQALGEVNIGAIEEYERVSERFNFLSTQRDDLIEAKATLYKVIEEVDTEMTKLFKESFEAIREQFHTVFSKLFDGGKADLILTDPDNLLDTGIEIIAQPPGKKLQNLALLSGGEKALTAITLLFAILRVKPVPFSVLDEVEAALDESNVIRFSDYLKEFCEQTQFIVVTHRKGTMEGADVLYGVTMQESGVSRLVSVKLEEKEKIAQMA